MSTDTSDTEVEPVSQEANQEPLLSALFLIKFDQKVGYVVSWKRSAIDVPLDGAVEFKSLPSGLHTVKSDLIYFIHEGYAGLSAFANIPAEESERNAHFVAVGVLLPLSYGRLGRSWLHAQSLQKLAFALATDSTATTLLEEYWDKYRSNRPENGKPNSSSESGLESSAGGAAVKGHSRARALSMLTVAHPDSRQALPAYHPALSILQYLDLFGPLVFRLHQAALLRKRILFVATPPVRRVCEFVYDLSVLSSIPHSAIDLLSPDTISLHRLRSLFTIGIHDIPLLEKIQKAEDGDGSPVNISGPEEGWVACTTDEIIATKSQLYDIVIQIPPDYNRAAEKRQWPTIKTNAGHQIKSTRRDVWRYRLLRHELGKYIHEAESAVTDEDEDDRAALLNQKKPDTNHTEDEVYGDDVLEPMTWSQLAYSGFMWWASAGEKDAYLDEEQDRDRELLGDLSEFLVNEQQNGNRHPDQSINGCLHTAIIAYFHRLTANLITRLADLIESEEEETKDDAPLRVDRDDLSRLGLDVWSEGEQSFLQEFSMLYFDRRAEVHGTNLECCGVRIV